MTAIGGWQVGQRIARHRDARAGSIVEVGIMVKVKWDNGATSYYPLDAEEHIRSLDADQRPPWRRAKEKATSRV